MAFVLTSKPLPCDIEAVTLPSAICERFNPVTPDAGMFVKPVASPTNEPEINSNEPYISIKL